MKQMCGVFDRRLNTLQIMNEKGYLVVVRFGTRRDRRHRREDVMKLLEKKGK
jgi:hypothetical protein